MVADVPSHAEVVARADGVLGELVLRRRPPSPGCGDDAVYELISGGVFLMDTEDATSERLLADAVLSALAGQVAGPVPDDGLRVLVAGLGLGFTAAAVLAWPCVSKVVVVEIEPVLCGWLRDGLVPAAAGLLDDARLHVVHADVLDLLPGLPPDGFHAMLLDVDNGPDFLTHPSNASLYEAPALRAASVALRPRGVLAVWSAERSPALEQAMENAMGRTVELPVVVHRQGRDLEYLLYLATRATPATPPSPRPGRRRDPQECDEAS